MKGMSEFLIVRTLVSFMEWLIQLNNFSVKKLFKVTVMQIEKPLINGRLRVFKKYLESFVFQLFIILQ